VYQLYGVTTPSEAKKKLTEVAIPKENPENLEEWILSQVGPDIYEIFIKGYTQKQWQRDPKDLPASLIKRSPIRLTFDDNYFNDQYQGIPIGGYTKVFKRMLEGVEVKLSTDYFEQKNYWDSIAKTVVYTGKIDEYFGYKFGQLDYRALRFESKILEGDYQGNAVINYTEEEIPYTRIIEHKHFEFGDQPRTVVTKEFPTEYKIDDIPYYPINTKSNNKLYKQYKKEAVKEHNLLLGGRLATYKYLDMDDVILSAMDIVNNFKQGS
ncbi:MAG: UDP-galactopyranose mutase, partial [Planctomycetota bacterium]